MPSTILLKDIPADVYEFILQEQMKLTLHRQSKVSLNITVIKMIRELKSSRQNDKSGTNKSQQN